MDIEKLTERLEQIEGDLETITKAKDTAEASVATLTAQVATLTTDLEKAKAAKPEPKADETDEDVLKGLPQAVRDRLEAAEATAKDALTEVEKARGERELEIDIAKVRELGVQDVEGLGGLLHRIRKGKSTAEDADKVVEVLTIAKAVGDKGDVLFTAIGKAKGKDVGATNADDAQAKLDEAVEAISKAKPSLTKEQAYDEALQANPHLYDEINKRHPDLVGE